MSRYAIFFAPLRDDPLTVAAARWLGRDAFSGDRIDRPSPVDGLDRQAFDAATKSPRRYGFHGTLKAPFELADGRTILELEEALSAYCATLSSFTLPKFRVGQLGPFFALLPETASQELSALASGLVRDFDEFRAPLSEADMARRNPDELSTAQRENLINWGYPYIFENFRFHMTLSDPISEELKDRFDEAANRHFEPHISKAQSVTALSLFEEPARGEPFRVIRQIPIA